MHFFLESFSFKNDHNQFTDQQQIQNEKSTNNLKS